MTRKARNKFLTIGLIAIFLFSNFSNALVAFADNGNVGITDLSKPDAAYTLDYEIDNDTMKGYFEKPAVLLEKDGKQYIQMSGNSGNMIEDVKVDGKSVQRDGTDNYTLQFEVTKSLDTQLDLAVHVNVEGVHERTYKVNLSFDESTKQETDAANYTLLLDQEIIVPEEEQPTEPENPTESEQPEESEGNEGTEEQPEEVETPEESEQPENTETPDETTKPEETEKPEDVEQPEETEKPEEVETPESQEKPEEVEKPGNEDKPGESEENNEVGQAIVPDAAYEVDSTILHEYEDKPSAANSFFNDKAIVLEYDGETYVQISLSSTIDLNMVSIHSVKNQLQNQFEDMVVVEEVDGNAFTYQFKLNGELADLVPVMFNLTVPMIPGYDNKEQKARIQLDADNKQALNASEQALITATNGNGPVIPVEPEPEQPDSEFAPDAAYTIDMVSSSSATNNNFLKEAVLLEKDGKQYIQMSGKSRSMILDLSINGKPVTFGDADLQGNYIFQFEVTKPLDTQLDFGMEIQAGPTVMNHTVDLAFDESTKKETDASKYTLLEIASDEIDSVLTPDTVKTVTYTTEGANIAGSYESEAIVLEKDGKTYVQLQGKSMRQFIEYLYINGEKMALSEAIADNGAYLAQFELPKSVESLSEEENKFTFDMIINARGNLMAHKTVITFDQDSIKEVDKNDHTLVEDTSTVNSNDIISSEDQVEVGYESVGADLSRHFNDTATIIEKDGKQYLQLHGKSGQQFVDALFIDGKRMTIGEAQADQTYLAQYELPTTIEENDTYMFTMLINAMGRIMMHSAEITLIPDAEEPENPSEPEQPENPDETEKPEEPTEPEVSGELVAEKATEVSYEMLQNNSDEISTANAFFTGKAVVLDYQGERYAQITAQGKNTSMIESLKNKVADKESEMVIVEEKDDKKVYQFKLEKSLKNDVPLKMKINVPGLYETEHDVRLRFDSSSEKSLDPSKYTLVASTNANGPDGDNAQNPGEEKPDNGEKPDTGEKPDNGEKPGNGEKPTKPAEKPSKPSKDKSLVAEKAYTVNYKLLQENNNDVSAADNFFQKPAVVLEHKGNTYVQIAVDPKVDVNTFAINKMQNKLKGKFVDMVVVERTNGIPTKYQFKLDGKLSQAVPVLFNLTVPGFYEDQTHKARIVFDLASKKEVAASKYTLVASTNANGPDGENAQTPTEEPKRDNLKKPSNTKKQTKKSAVNKEGKITPDKAYTVDYVIKKDKSNEKSVANDFFTGKALLLERGNDTYVQITTEANSPQFIDSMKSKLGNKFVEMVVAEVKSSGAYVYQFKLPGTVKDDVLLRMIITVPGVYENQEHDARLVFDASTLKETDAGNHQIVASTNAQGPSGKGAVNPEKPAFGAGEADALAVAADGAQTDKVANPKTSDKTKIFIYITLLLGAGAVLFFQFRRRTVTES